jgi:hypothetical protein
MRYAQLGTSGLTVSRLALGTMTFGHYSFAGFHANVEQASADRMVGSRSTRASTCSTPPRDTGRARARRCSARRCAVRACASGR